MTVQEHVALQGKTTMRIGGTARYFAEITSKEDVETAVQFAKEHSVPLIPLGGGSNTIFADGVINALIIRITASDTTISDAHVTVQSGKNLPMLINELAKEGLDLSPLTGILGTIGGAVFGNAGQGPNGIWIDTYIESVEAFINGQWKTMSKEECKFSYRNSWFKHEQTNKRTNLPRRQAGEQTSIIWSVTLTIPQKPSNEIQNEINRLLAKRVETQPHRKTAGSCFKAVGTVPAWQLIDAAGLRKTKSGGISISEKHANFLINEGGGTFADAMHVIETIENGIPEGLEVEMRCIQEDGTCTY